MDSIDGDTTQFDDPDGITPCLPINYAFTARDALAGASLYVFLVGPMLGLMKAFGISNRIYPDYQFTVAHLWQLMLAVIVAALISGIGGKYMWLLAMCRILSRASVGPLIAYGRPRRISRFDRALIVRFYPLRGPAVESRLRPTISAEKGYNLQVGAFAGGALLSLAISFLPLMHGDPRPRSLAIGLAGLALFLYLLGLVIKRIEGKSK